MFDAVNINDSVRSILVYDYNSGPWNERRGLRDLLEVRPRWAESAFGQVELACLKVRHDLLDRLFGRPLHDYVTIGAETLNDFKLLVRVSAAHL